MRIGFITVSHPDYIDGVVDRAVEQATGGLRERLGPLGIELCPCGELICDSLAAERAAKGLVQADVDGVILFLGSWVECPVAMSVIREVEHLPLLLWGFPMVRDGDKLQSTGSYVSYSMFKGVLDRAGYRFKGLLDSVDSPEALEAVEAFCVAATAVQRLKRSRVGLLGYTSMSIYTGTFDHLLMRVRIGPEIEHIDGSTYFRMVEKIDPERLPEAKALLRASTRIASNVSEGDLERISRMYLALQDLTRQRRLHAVNIKCQYEFSKEYGMVPCVPLSLAADHGVVASCEGDILNTVSMMMLSLLSSSVVTYGDSIHHEGNVLKLSSCGFSPFSMGTAGEQSIRQFPPNLGFSGVLTSFVLRPERVTVMRLVEDVGDYHLLYFTGEGQPTGLRGGAFPALDVLLDGDVNRLVENYAGQHFALCYGDVSGRVEDMARILGIRAVRV